MSKRKVEEFDLETGDGVQSNKAVKLDSKVCKKKHTLDSDEEDSGDDERSNVLPDDDIEGEEEGVSGIHEEIKITPFNMREELEEGHFDKEGHFHWDKDKELKDNWLDNIDWIKVKSDKNYIEKTNSGLADSSDSDEDESSKKFNELATYKEIVSFMLPLETVKKCLQRLGSKRENISSSERWRRRKAGIIDENASIVTKFTELANNILTELGNMNIYEETYEFIQKKIKQKSIFSAGSSSNVAEDLDMYSDDFHSKEKKIKLDPTIVEKEESGLKWEFKWKQEDEEIHGPFSTEQMQQWVDEDYFKKGVFVRKCNIDDSKFYSSHRIDFELYL